MQWRRRRSRIDARDQFDAGAPAQRLTINGRNFGVRQATFQGNPRSGDVSVPGWILSVVSWSDSQIQVDVSVPVDDAGQKTLTVTSIGTTGNFFYAPQGQGPSTQNTATAQVRANASNPTVTLNSFRWHSTGAYYIDNVDWSQDSVSSDGTTLVEHPQWTSGRSDPIVLFPGLRPTISDVVLSASGSFSGAAKVRVVSSTNSPPWLMFPSAIDVSFSNGTATYSFTGLDSSGTPSGIDNLRSVTLRWEVSFNGGLAWSAFGSTIHSLLVTANAPRSTPEAPCAPSCVAFPGSRITAARLNYATLTFKGNDQTLRQEVFSRVRNQMKTGGRSVLDAGEAAYRDIWRLITTANTAATGFDCSTLALGSVVLLNLLGRDFGLHFAYATYDDRFGGPNGLPAPQVAWNAAVMKTGAYGQDSRFLWFTNPDVRSSGQAYEGFVLDNSTQEAFTLYPLSGPIAADVFDQIQNNQPLLVKVSFAVMRDTLRTSHWLFSTGQKWVGPPADDFVSGVVPFPVPLPQ